MIRKLTSLLFALSALTILALLPAESARAAAPQSADCECNASLDILPNVQCTSSFSVTGATTTPAECEDYGDGCEEVDGRECKATGTWHVVWPIPGGGITQGSGPFSLEAPCRGRDTKEIACDNQTPPSAFHTLRLVCGPCEEV